MLKVFSVDVYDLLDPGTTLSFVTPFIAKKFEILPDISNEPYGVYPGGWDGSCKKGVEKLSNNVAQ